jgi:hypothetical protein
LQALHHKILGKWFIVILAACLCYIQASITADLANRSESTLACEAMSSHGQASHRVYEAVMRSHCISHLGTLVATCYMVHSNIHANANKAACIITLHWSYWQVIIYENVRYWCEYGMSIAHMMIGTPIATEAGIVPPGVFYSERLWLFGTEFAGVINLNQTPKL